MSKPVVITIPHQLGAAEARRRIEEGLSQLSGQMPGGMASVSQRWTGDRLSFSADVMGQGVGGWLEVKADAVRMEILLPGFLAMMANKVKGVVEKRGQILLEKK